MRTLIDRFNKILSISATIGAALFLVATRSVNEAASSNTIVDFETIQSGWRVLKTLWEVKKLWWLVELHSATVCLVASRRRCQRGSGGTGERKEKRRQHNALSKERDEFQGIGKVHSIFVHLSTLHH